MPKAALLPGKEGVQVYISRGRNLIVAIKMVPPRFDDGGRQISFPSVRASFRNHRFETKDASVIEKLESARGFGLGRDFWLLEDEVKDNAVRAADGFAKQLETLDLSQLPAALLEKLRAGLGAVVKPDFDPEA